MEIHEILLGPVVTERATEMADRYNQAAFKVAVKANKHQIRRAVESLYGVAVEGVRTMIIRGKRKRRGMKVGKRPNWKKAIVTLKEGSVIDFLATE